jgi:RNA-binding protein YhbY
MAITYNFRRGAEIDGIDPQTAGEELARITEHHGNLTAVVVVNEARPDDAPLHPVFEWDDAVAAELHRQLQADTLIKAVQVVRTMDEPDEPVFVKVRSARNYQPVEQVAQRLDLYEEAFRDACKRLGEAQAALEQLVAVAARLNPQMKPRAAKAAQIVGRVRDGLPTGRL